MMSLQNDSEKKRCRAIHLAFARHRLIDRTTTKEHISESAYQQVDYQNIRKSGTEPTICYLIFCGSDGLFADALMV